jgi:hypothetical protein
MKKLLVVILALAACSPRPIQPADAPRMAPADGNVTVESNPAATPDPALERLTALAREDLARRLALDPGRIHLIEAEATTWPDTSLGCPQPGVAYAPMATPGFRLLLEALGQTYACHTDTGQHVVLCGSVGLPNDPVPIMPVAPHGKPPKCNWAPCP